MDHLFTPWRRDYVESSKVPGCIFCTVLDGTDKDGLIIYRGQLAYVILNRYPYTNGHLMAVPYQHVESLEMLDAPTRAEMIELVSQSIHVLRTVYQPQGFNLGGNIGQAAGAGVTDHVHLHVLPRWTGDTNFMTAVGGTRILPETVQDSWERIQKGWE